MSNKGLRETPRSMINNDNYDSGYDRIFSGKPERGSYVQVKTEDGWKLVPKSEAHLHRESKAPMVMGDMAEYLSPIDGSRISSRSHHRAHMRQHGVIEVGNEKLSGPAEYKPTSAVEDIQRAIYEASR